MTLESVGSASPEIKIPRSDWVRWTAFVLAALTVVFYVPLLFPVAPSISDSYIFGYNNRIGVLLLFLFLLLGGLLSKSLRVTFHAASFPTEQIPRKQVRRWMGIFTAGWAIMYFLMHGLEGFGESIYLIDRIKMLVAGGTPYKDFEFAYGPLFLHGPRLLMLLHLGVETSYYIFWLILLLSGPWMLAQTLDLLDYPSSYKSNIYSLLCIFAFLSVISTGLNYTLFRFIFAPYLALRVQHTYAFGGPKRLELAMLTAIGSIALILLVSPEMGLAFAAGITGYFFFFGLLQKQFTYTGNLVSYAFFLLAEGCVLWGADKLNLFATLKAFSSGAFSYPIVPAGHILFFFFCCGLVTLYVASRLRSRSQGDGMMVVLAVSALSIVAAMGRCDVWHVGFSAMGILIVATVLASTMPRLWIAYRFAFFIFFIAIPAVETRGVYQAPIAKLLFLRALQAEPQDTTTRLDRIAERSMSRTWGQPVAHIRFSANKALSRFAFNGDQGPLYSNSNEVLNAPFGYTPTRFGTYHAKSIDSGYYLGLDNALTPQAVAAKVAELQSHPDRDLLLPQDFSAECNIDKEGEQHFIRKLFVYPYNGRVKHRENLWQPLCDSIAHSYHLVREAQPLGYGYQVWGRSIEAR